MADDYLDAQLTYLTESAIRGPCIIASMSERMNSPVHAPAPPRVLAATSCNSGTCPTVYENGPGKVIVQGFVVSPASTGIDVPDGEMLVEVPVELLADALNKMSGAN